MWKFVVLSSLIISRTAAQNPGSRPFDNGHGWDIRLAVPGEPGRDYPTLHSIPKTSFSCSGKEPGYYADIETNCQVFRVCTLGSTYGFQSFLCPNGTLFNQAVFVCDWWMKVNCKKSGELYKINNEKYGNLKLGPQFMTNIKKMITNPMRNPYNEIYTKNQLIVTQEYNPSQIQLFNNKNPNSAYFRAKQTSQLQNIYSTADTLFAASTPSIQYSTNFSIFQPMNNHNIQRHKHQKSYVLPNRTGIPKNLQFLNSHSGQTSQSQNIVDKYIPTQNYQRSLQLSNPQENVKNNINSDYKGGNLIFTYNKSKNKHTEFGIEFAKQQLNQNIKQDRPLNSDKDSQTLHSKTVEGVENKTKQNLVSNEAPPAIITKTLAFRSLIKDPTNGNPKSRITFKTWILRPSKNSKLITEPTPYIYRRSSNLFERVIDENSVVDKPEIQAGEVKTENSYVYNAPTIKLDNEIITISQDQSANSDSVTTSQPEILTTYIPPTALPTEPSSLYLIPTTFKPSSLLYIPPAESEKQINRQYLSPLIKNSKIVSISSSPRPFTPLNKNEPSFFFSKQTQINTNQNNLAFSDILTREKLDITVDKIVKDTNDVLETASPEEFQYVKTDVYSPDYPFDNYLHLDSDLDTQSDEKLTLHPLPPPLPRNSRLIATPSSKLEPPIESFINLNQMKNPISRLPFYEEFTRRPNIIERTISLKITIPENIAQILFKNSTISNSDTLEILKTDNSNNWLLINKVNNEEADVTPIGRLIWNQNSNISNSQDLVFSLLLDSINAAKQFNNVAQQNIVSPAQPMLTQPQFQNIENEKLQQISKDISQLTSTQFSPSNNSASLRLANQGRNLSSLSKDKTKATTKSYVQKQVLKQQKLIPQQNIQKQVLYSLPTNIDDVNIQINSDKLYSGQLYQLPVPIVTKEIYNSPFPANFKLPTNALTLDTNINLIDDVNQSNVDVEIIKSPNNFKSVNKLTKSNKDQDGSVNAVKNTLKLPQNGITAQLQDNIVGTLPYLQDDSKIIKYKKDQTYYIYSHLNDDNENQNIIGNGLANTILPQNEKSPKLSAFQLLPSLSYTLQNGKEKENIFKTFQLNEYGNTQAFSNKNANLIRREDAISNIGYVVERPKSTVEKPRVLQSLYDGPNSYSTPQRSVVNSIEEQNNSNGLSNLNSKIEKLDTNEDTNNYGYPKIIPAKRFLF